MTVSKLHRICSTWTEAEQKLKNRYDTQKKALDAIVPERSGDKQSTVGAGSARDEPDYEATVTCWKQAIEVEMHFNDIALRIRGLVVTVLVAAFGAAGWAVKEAVQLGPIPGAAAILLVGAVAVALFWFMDEAWYHRLLLGSVTHALMIEEAFSSALPELGLSKMIGVYSPWKVPLLDVAMHSVGKMRIFYGGSFLVLLVTGAMFLVYQPTLRSESTDTKIEYIDQYVREQRPSAAEEAGQMCLEPL